LGETSRGGLIVIRNPSSRIVITQADVDGQPVLDRPGILEVEGEAVSVDLPDIAVIKEKLA
jgi:hypothetical protein